MNKRYLIGMAVIVIVFSIAGYIFWGSNRKAEEKEYEHLLRNAKEYENETDFEKAENEYLDAINKIPQNSDAYIELSELYISQGEKEGAKNILKAGVGTVNKAEKVKVYEKLSLIDWKDLVTEYEGKFGTIEYDEQSGMKGVCFMEEVDFNNDGIHEFVLVYQTSDSYMYEVWGYDKEDIIKVGEGELYGTDGGVKNLILGQYDGQRYIVTGKEDDECNREYWGYKNGVLEVVRTSSRQYINGDWVYKINEKTVSAEEWEAEENKWFQWKENEGRLVFDRHKENQALYNAVAKMKDKLKLASTYEANETVNSELPEEKLLSMEEALTLLEKSIPIDTADLACQPGVEVSSAKYEYTGKEIYKDENCYTFVMKIQANIPYESLDIYYVSENGKKIYIANINSGSVGEIEV